MEEQKAEGLDGARDRHKVSVQSLELPPDGSRSPSTSEEGLLGVWLGGQDAALCAQWAQTVGGPNDDSSSSCCELGL